VIDVPHLLKNVRNNFQKTAGSLLADLGHACTPGTLCVIDKSFKPVYKPCMKMLENRSVADELNSLNKSNIRGHVDESELRLLINEYFAGDEDVDSKLSDDSDDERDDGKTNSLLQPACTDVSECETEADDDETDGLVVVEPVSAVVGPSGSNVPKAVCDDKDNELARVKAFSCNCQHYNGGSCFQQFSYDFMMNRRLEMKSLTEGMQIQN